MQDSLTLATWVLAVVTTVLAILTGWYAYSTHRIVRRMDREREEKSRPSLTFQLIPWEANMLKLRMQNLGPGPALKLKGTIETVLKNGSSASVNWSYPLLASEKYEEFGIPMPGDAGNTSAHEFNKIRQNVASARARFSYQSSSGRQYCLDETIDMASITEDWVTSRMMATEDHPDRVLPRIARALEKLVRR